MRSPKQILPQFPARADVDEGHDDAEDEQEDELEVEEGDGVRGVGGGGRHKGPSINDVHKIVELFLPPPLAHIWC